jgi:hypothetical protein
LRIQDEALIDCIWKPLSVCEQRGRPREKGPKRKKGSLKTGVPHPLHIERMFIARFRASDVRAKILCTRSRDPAPNKPVGTNLDSRRHRFSGRMSID